jgi:hypothetical protein
MPLLNRSDMPPFITDENAHFPMSDGNKDWLVIVTREALEDVSGSQIVSGEWLIAKSEFFGSVASFKIALGRAGEEATVWVQSEDVTKWRDSKG